MASRSSPWDTIKAVAWSFVGLRRREDLERDGQKLNPIHVIVAGFVGVVLLLAVLMGLVHWIVAP